MRFNILTCSLLGVICIPFFMSCDNYKYKKVTGCHLDKMHLKGNVVRVETIVQSTIPLTEVFFNSFDPQYALSMYAGNICIDFDNHGNVKRNVGYGIDGKVLFESRLYQPDSMMDTTPCVFVGPNAKECIDRVVTISDDSGNCINADYYDGNTLVWKQKVQYDTDGCINTITKEYENLRIKSGWFDKIYSDTTYFYYTKYDEFGNWTEVMIDYKGILPNHAHFYKIKRQITYWGEKEKQELVKELKNYNKQAVDMTNQTANVQFGQYGSMSIPDYMVLQSHDEVGRVTKELPVNITSQMEYLFQSVYDKSDAYATICVNLVYGNNSEGFDNMTQEELRYSEELNEYLEVTNTQEMGSNGIYVLKWLPYRFVKISGRNALNVRYYRYGIGSPIPVYCESYTMSVSDGNFVCVNFSFQSDLYNRFYMDFVNSIESINFNTDTK